jgi:hypothetical protein
MNPTHSDQEAVILLHGLARTKRSLSKLEKRLIAAGYTVLNLSYPSRKYSIEKLADIALTETLSSFQQFKKVHFVTHSMGGIVLRYFLNKNKLNNMGRVVMMAPPNNGSQIIDRLGSLELFKIINGPAGLELGTSPNSLPNTLGSPHYELGVIAGTKSLNLYSVFILPGEDDGKVTVESTKLKGMRDHIAMPVTHTFMMNNKMVYEQILSFLNYGKFNH